MEKPDFQRFANALGVACELFGKELSPMAVKAYFRTLERYPIEEVEKAVEAAVVHCRFFPKPVELTEFITGTPENIEDRAQVQAGQVVNTVKRIGQYQSVNFNDPVTNAVILQGFGGWVRLCREMTVKNEGWIQKDFVKIYSAYARQGIQSDGHLSGLTEQQNENLGYLDYIPQPVMIGAPERKQIEAPADDKKVLEEIGI